MSEGETLSILVILSGMFPLMNEYQQNAVHKEITDLEFNPVKAAAERYVRSATSFILANFIAALPPKPSASSPYSRTQQAFAEQGRSASQILREQEEQDQIIDELSDEDLKELLPKAADNVPNIAPLVLKKNPRTSRLAKGVIVQYLKHGGAR